MVLRLTEPRSEIEALTRFLGGWTSLGIALMFHAMIPDAIIAWTKNAPIGDRCRFTDDRSGLGGVPPISAFLRLGWQP